MYQEPVPHADVQKRRMHYKHGLLSRRAAPGTPCSALRFTTRAYPGLSHRLTGRSASTTPVAMREDLGSMCMSKAMWTVFLVSGMITPACLPMLWNESRGETRFAW